MSSRLFLIVAVLSIVSTARAQQPGEPCAPGTTAICFTETDTLECLDGEYAQFPCAVVNGDGCGTCDALGAFCFNDREIINVRSEAELRCTDAGCDSGGCDGTDAVDCIAGYAATRTDCAVTGRVCVPNEETNVGACVVGDEECGGAGVGGCAGTVATICSGGTFVNTVDCADVGRRCATLNDSGEVGCVEAPPPEPATPCDDDADCDGDDVCDDGECERPASNRPPRGSEDEDETSSCAQTATLPLWPAALLLLRRRRR